MKNKGPVLYNPFAEIPDTRRRRRTVSNIYDEALSGVQVLINIKNEVLNVIILIVLEVINLLFDFFIHPCFLYSENQIVSRFDQFHEALRR